nr:HrpF/NolX family T3SS translocon protein [Pseudomonas sp. 3400]
MRVSGFSSSIPPAIDSHELSRECAKPQAPVNPRQSACGGGGVSWAPQGQSQQAAPGSSTATGDNLRGQGLAALREAVRALFAPSTAEVQSASQPVTQRNVAAQAAKEGSDEMPFEEVISVLGRNENLLKKPRDREGLEKLRDDPNTPTDAKKALDAVLKNPAYYEALDQAKTGSTDGKISAKDVQKLQQHPLIRQYADAKAETYTHNYVPSDAAPGSAAREMTENDAMRELYLYSESLPKKLNLETLGKIADGSQSMGKCPPQVAAAAKFFVQNPDKWQQFSGKDDPSAKISRDRLCDLAAENVKLSPQESKALETLKNNQDIFFKGGGIKPDKLAKIANDPQHSQEVRDAANLLSQPNSMLFSMLDNAKHGAGGNFFNKANDRNISKGDLNAFLQKGSNEVAGPPQLAKPTTVAALAAQSDMHMGQETQPDQKKEKGGGIFKFLEIFSYVASGVMMLIPGAGAATLAATAGRVAATTVAKEAAKQAAQHTVKEVAKETVKETAKREFKDAAIQGAKDGLKDYAKDQASGFAKDGLSNTMNQNPPRVASNPDVNAPRVWAQS